MVMMVFHEPSSPRIEDVNTLWSGFFSSVTSLNLEGVCGLGTGPFVSHVRIFTLETIWPRIAEFFKMKYAWMCCNFVVKPKAGVDDQKFSSSQRTDRE